MEKITTTTSLKDAISELEKQRNFQERRLEENWEYLTESIRPVNIIKRTLHDILPTEHSKNNLLGSAIGLGTGFITKKLFVGKTPGFVKSLLGNIIQWSITALVAKNSNKLKLGGQTLIRKIIPEKHPNDALH
jgi:hypothetical protein